MTAIAVSVPWLFGFLLDCSAPIREKDGRIVVLFDHSPGGRRETRRGRTPPLWIGLRAFAEVVELRGFPWIETTAMRIEDNPHACEVGVAHATSH